MSSTNTTPNYGLPQFVNTDVPSWLGDFNSAMSKIDTQMKSNDTKATGASTNAENANSSATQALETANQANTTANGANTSATNALSAANNANENANTAKQNAATALQTANTASGNASSALSMAQNANTNATKALNGLDKFNLKNSMLFNSSTGNIVNGQNCGSDFGNSGLTLAYDDTKSIFKLYGILRINNPDNGGLNRTVKLLNTPLRPTKDITLICCGLTAYGQNLEKVDQCSITVKTDGTIELNTWFNVDNSSKQVRVFFWNSLYLLQAFEQEEITPGQ
jgi:hypothetical protein